MEARESARHSSARPNFREAQLRSCGRGQNGAVSQLPTTWSADGFLRSPFCRAGSLASGQNQGSELGGNANHEADHTDLKQISLR